MGTTFHELIVVRPGAAGLRKSDVDCDALLAAGQETVMHRC